MSAREVEVTGPSTCNGEGCVGWAGAEPQAWRTGHAEGYALRWPGYRQEEHRHRAGGAVAQGRGALLGQIANELAALERVRKRLQKDGRELGVCYEAGPCGYGLHRWLNGKPGVSCQVVAPSLTPRRPGVRVKTN